jgi:hypothetical protein
VFQWMAGLAPAGRGFPTVSLRGSMVASRAGKQEDKPYVEISVPLFGRVGSSWQGFPAVSLRGFMAASRAGKQEEQPYLEISMFQWMAGLAPAGRGFPAVSRRGSMGASRAGKQEEQLYLEISVPVDGLVGPSWQGVSCRVPQGFHGRLQGRKARSTTVPGDKCSSGWQGWPQLAGGSLQCPAGVPWAPPGQESKKNNSTWR